MFLSVSAVAVYAPMLGRDTPHHPSLSPPERQLPRDIHHALARGLTLSEIAEFIKISERCLYYVRPAAFVLRNKSRG